MSIVGRIIPSLRRIAQDLNYYSSKVDVLRRIRDTYGIKVDPRTDPEYIEILDGSLKRLPPQLVRDCGITVIRFEDMGPSREYYPNHGKYLDGTLVLNSQIVEDPLLIVDFNTGQAINKFDQTFYHELGHGWDETQGEGKDRELSVRDDWLSLSGWSKDPKPGLKRIKIKEEGSPEIVGEWYYDPDAQFTRFYAKRNPLDDFADTFSYYVGGMKSFLPENKIKYFDDRLSKYKEGVAV